MVTTRGGYDFIQRPQSWLANSKIYRAGFEKHRSVLPLFKLLDRNKIIDFYKYYFKFTR